MNREQFDALVRDIERRFARRPTSLKWRVFLWAVVGYCGFFAWIAFVLLLGIVLLIPGIRLGVDGIVFYILSGLILLGGGAAVVRALVVRIPPLEGRKVTRDEAPALFGMLDELRGRLRASHFHAVAFVPEFNASVRQTPRLSIFGWWRNYLLLGLPLLDSLSPEEFKGVLAHEFAHLSKEHARFSHWLYRLRRSWERVFETNFRRPRFEGEVSLRIVLSKFVDWFWPRFNAHAFVFSRASEYEADALAAEVAGKESVVSALIRIRVLDAVLDETFWPDFWQLATQQPAPPGDVLQRMRESLRKPLAQERMTSLLDQSLRAVTTNADTHPCLRDRLTALGTQVWSPGFSRRNGSTSSSVTESAEAGTPNLIGLLRTSEVSAADALLGSALSKVRADVEKEWQTKCQPSWKERYARATALQDRLQNIDLAIGKSAANVDGLWDKARALIDLRGDEAAAGLLREILAHQADHPQANFYLGRHLLEKDDPAGETHLEKVMTADESAIPQACELLYQFHRRCGNADRLRQLDARLDQYEKSLEASRAERNSISASDPLIAHGLEANELTALQKVLAAEPNLASAHLARKELKFFPKQKLFLLCVRSRRPWHGFTNRDHEEQIVRHLSQTVQLPGRLLVFAPHGSYRSLAQRLEKLKHAAIFPATPL